MTTEQVLLGVIAGSLAVMALIQVGAIVAALRAVRRVESRVDQLASEFDTTVKPLVANLTTMSAEASRAAKLAATQVERLDQVFTDVVARVDQTLTTAQQFVVAPAREGMAILAGVKAAVGALKGFREATRRRSATRAMTLEEEEESLFIG